LEFHVDGKSIQMDACVVLETRSVVDALRAEMQSQILRGSIPPGTALTELSVAQKFDVARPTAKAAIEQLVHIGLLRRLRNKTARVPLLDAADVADLYLSRGVIERAVVRLLAERGDVPPGAAEAVDRFRAAIASGGKVTDLVESDIEFHRALVAASRSPRLRRLHEAVIGEAHLCMAQVQVRSLLHPQVIADEHAHILAMIEARDTDRAAAEMDAHLSRARKKLVAYLHEEEAALASDQVR
jgi:DNA-binding GntR family transcriptional regulator